MKHLYILILALIVGQQGFAQNKNEFDTFKNDILSQFDTYFENIEMSGDGKIILYAKEAYNTLLPVKKNNIMRTVLSDRTEEFAIVRYQYKSELWKKETKNNRVTLIDGWDMNSIMQKATLKTNSHPWFFYLGAGGTYSDAISDVNNLNVSSRLGFFLLKNRWDLALSGTYTNISDGNSGFINSANVGLMTKVYFPIRKINISPYIGTGVSYITSLDDTSNSTLDTPIYIGISWIIGHGSLDIGYQYSSNADNSMFTIGYTFSLWSK